MINVKLWFELISDARCKKSWPAEVSPIFDVFKWCLFCEIVSADENITKIEKGALLL